MKFLTLYLVGYFVLLIGAAWALWESGILERDSGRLDRDRRDHRDRSRHHARGGVEPARGHHPSRKRRPARAFSGTVCVTAQTACLAYGRAFSFSSCLAAVVARALPRRRRHPDLQPRLRRRRAGRQGRARQRACRRKRGSRLPWGRKRFFDRRAFDADLKRIEAFYRDRGFPDARVTLVRRRSSMTRRTRSTSRQHLRRRTDPRVGDRARRASTCCPEDESAVAAGDAAAAGRSSRSIVSWPSRRASAR